MQSNPKESYWSKASRDTEKFRKDSKVWFLGVEVLGGGAIAALTAWVLWDRSTLHGWQVFLITFIVFVVGLLLMYGFIFLCHLFRAPYRQNAELKERVIILEKERISNITVVAETHKRASYERDKKTAWAQLKITNTSNINLNNVNVQIMELVQVYEKKKGKGVGTGIYNLSEPYPKWSPANVYWSERNCTIQSTRYAYPTRRSFQICLNSLSLRLESCSWLSQHTHTSPHA